MSPNGAAPVRIALTMHVNGRQRSSMNTNYCIVVAHQVFTQLSQRLMRRRNMRSILFGSATFALMTMGCASGGGVKVSTTAAPDAHLTMLRTFRVLETLQRRADAPALPANDPMLNNSITNRQLRADLVLGLQQKGYAIEETNPDFLVAFYAGTREKMDTTYWNPGPGWRYGYRGFGFRGSRFRSAWPWYGYASPFPAMQVSTYTQGAVIVDVIDPSTMELLWRGQGVATVSEDPMKYAQELDKSVGAILGKFPQAGR
jgi:hypothetical protein